MNLFSFSVKNINNLNNKNCQYEAKMNNFNFEKKNLKKAYEEKSEKFVNLNNKKKINSKVFKFQTKQNHFFTYGAKKITNLSYIKYNQMRKLKIKSNKNNILNKYKL